MYFVRILYKINLYILNTLTLCHLQTVYIYWKLVIYTKPMGKKHKIPRVCKSLISSSETRRVCHAFKKSVLQIVFL